MAKAKTTVKATVKAVEPVTNVVTMDQPQSKLHAEVLAYCDSIRKLTTDDLHALAVRCLTHAAPQEHGGHGDTRPLVALQNGLPNSLRKLALANWARDFAPLVWGKKDAKDNLDGCKHAKQGDKQHGKPWRLEDAAKVAFFDAPEVEKPKGIMDAIKQLQSQNTTYEKMLADPSILRKDGVTDEGLKAAIAMNNSMIAAASMHKAAA